MANSIGKKNSNFVSSKEDVAIDIEVNMEKKVEPLSSQLSKPLSERSRRYSYEMNDIKCKLAIQISTNRFSSFSTLIKVNINCEPIFMYCRLFISMVQTTVSWIIEMFLYLWGITCQTSKLEK